MYFLFSFPGSNSLVLNLWFQFSFQFSPLNSLFTELMFTFNNTLQAGKSYKAVCQGHSAALEPMIRSRVIDVTVHTRSLALGKECRVFQHSWARAVDGKCPMPKEAFSFAICSTRVQGWQLATLLFRTVRHDHLPRM